MGWGWGVRAKGVREDRSTGSCRLRWSAPLDGRAVNHYTNVHSPPSNSHRRISSSSELLPTPQHVSPGAFCSGPSPLVTYCQRGPSGRWEGWVRVWASGKSNACDVGEGMSSSNGGRS